MKRLLTLTAALLALVMVLSLSACGGDAETAEETAEETAAAETAEPAEAPEAAPEAAGVDLAALRDQLVADCGIAESINVETEALGNIYGIDTAQVVSSAGLQIATGAAFPGEVVMVQAVDEAAAAAVAENLNNHLGAIAEQAASYDPESLALAQNCAVVTNGTYVGMFFSEHYDAMVSAFQSALG